jgi:exodeoxyribonuclease VII small subunit
VGKKKSANSIPGDQDPSYAPADKTSSFEASLLEAEAVVQQLESGELTLDESFESYTRGVESLKRCYHHLRRVEKQIELLVGFNEAGGPITTPFEDSAETLEQKQSQRSLRRSTKGTEDFGNSLEEDFPDVDADSRRRVDGSQELF